MAKYSEDQEYLDIVNNIMKNDEFKKMANIKHHNTNRLDHSFRVSYNSYKIAKFLRLNYRDVARGGLLHDFYSEEISDCNKMKDKLKLFTIKHPKEAVENASKIFDLTEKEINIIRTHMFPIDYKIPKYAESWIVNMVDTTLSICEFSKKFGYKMAYGFNLYLIFILNNLK